MDLDETGGFAGAYIGGFLYRRGCYDGGFGAVWEKLTWTGPGELI